MVIVMHPRETDYFKSINTDSQVCNRTQAIYPSTLHLLQAASVICLAVDGVALHCWEVTVWKGGTACCSHVTTLILWSPQAPTTISEQPLTSEREGLTRQQGSWNGLVGQTQELCRWHMPVRVLGEGRQEQTHAAGRPFCLCFYTQEFAGVYTQLTHYSN